jgi:hypothetical protein
MDKYRAIHDKIFIVLTLCFLLKAIFLYHFNILRIMRHHWIRKLHDNSHQRETFFMQSVYRLNIIYEKFTQLNMIYEKFTQKGNKYCICKQCEIYSSYFQKYLKF